MLIHKQDLSLSTFCHIGGLCAEDQDVMARVAPFITPHLADLTEDFYAVLLTDEQTAPYLKDRIDTLKKTHLMWMNDLFSGNYDEAFIKRQEKIGDVHVKVRVPPLFVAASMCFLRAAIPPIINQNVPDATESSSAVASLMRLLDLCQFLIDRKYSEALMDNLGISPALLVRLQTLKTT